VNRAVRVDHAAHVAVPLDVGDADAGTEIDSLLPMHGGVTLTDFGARDAAERHVTHG